MRCWTSLVLAVMAVSTAADPAALQEVRPWICSLAYCSCHDDNSSLDISLSPPVLPANDHGHSGCRKGRVTLGASIIIPISCFLSPQFSQKADVQVGGCVAGQCAGGGVQVGPNGAGYNAGVSGGIPQANGGVNGGQSVEFGKPGGGRALATEVEKEADKVGRGPCHCIR